MLRNDILYGNIAPGHCCGTHERACLDLIRNDGVVGSVQGSDTADADDVGSCALDVGSHAV